MFTNFLAKKKLYFLSILAFISVLTLVLYHQGYFLKPTNFTECSALKGSTIQESYPATCITKSGLRFAQQLSPEERQRLLPPPNDGNFSCPDSGYIDCMPIVGASVKCSDLHIKWVEANCPHFQGIAY